MNTPSHFIMTAALDKALPRVPIVKRAFLLGSVVPDLPLWLLSIGGLVYYHLLQGLTMAETTRLMFDNLYFHDPFWIACHNSLHSPVMLLLGVSAVWRSRRNIESGSRWWFWFFMACLFHSAIDILTHHDDGPLLFFPLNWTVRFYSPVSYWDPNHFGNQFQLFELLLDSALLIYLLKGQACRAFRKFQSFQANR
jgi:membrane-bound metal-dependent hydrolase YbcI (DUF457 family)